MMVHQAESAILVINSGSSSIKFSVYRIDGKDLCLSLKGQLQAVGTHPVFEARCDRGELLANESWSKMASFADHMKSLIEWIEAHMGDARIEIAGHRVVHGGRKFSEPVALTPDIIEELETLVQLAPLHQPYNLMAIRALAEAHPGLLQVACFDTAFHYDNEPLVRLFALPRHLLEDGILRYGFHGLSYEFIAARHARLAPDEVSGKWVVCHLGSGASLCAIRNGRSVASTMGFTALDGIPMGTRTGQIDPGVLLYLMEQKGFSLQELTELLYKKSGLLGLSGISNDLRELQDSEDPNAKEAIDFFVYRIAREIGSLSVAMEGIDGIIFTAGIGENSHAIRAGIVKWIAWLGFSINHLANIKCREGRISTDESKIIRVIPTDEELMIATHSASFIGYPGSSTPSI